MFVLRKITGADVEINIGLGDGYTLIRKDCNPKDFEMCAGHGGFDVEQDGIFAFVSAHGGREIFPLYASQKNYIMTGQGTTFACVSA